MLGNRRTGTDRRTGPDLNRRHEFDTGPNESTVTDKSPMLVSPVIITDDRPGTNVHGRADCGVTDIGQVIDLTANANRTLLYFDKIPDAYLIPEIGFRPKSRERAISQSAPMVASSITQFA